MDAANDSTAQSEADAQISAQIAALKAEHRDLDEAIARLANVPQEDELLLRRLKKRKLLIKDRIEQLLRQREPDEYA